MKFNMKTTATVGINLATLARLTSAGQVTMQAQPLVDPRRPKLRSFSEFKTFGEPGLEKAFALAKRFAARVREHPHAGQYMLTLAGVSGTGKTMLAQCVLNDLGLDAWGNLSALPRWVESRERRSADAVMRDCRRLAEKVQAREIDLAASLAAPFLLVLDDFGAWHDPSGFVAEKFDGLLRRRRDKWTFITTNLLLADIAEKEGRTASWMIRDGNTVHELTCKDFALRK